MKKVFAVMLLVASVFVMTSCDDDDDNQINYYSMGFDSLYASGTEFLSESVTIEDAFKEQLGVEDSIFYLEGSSSECDAEVEAACALAEASLSGTVFSFTFEYIVTNTSSNEVIYTYTYPNE